MNATKTEVRYPEVKVRLSGTDGNVFALIGTCFKAGRKAGVPREDLETFRSECFRSESYDAALRVMMAWFDVD